MKPQACTHAIGSASTCPHCGWRTCPVCHRGPRHLDHCPDTKRQETPSR